MTLFAGVTAHRREDDHQRFIYLMNFTGQQQTVDTCDGLTSAFTGAPAAPSIVMQPYDVSILVQAKRSETA
jgi:hypothetical protein